MEERKITFAENYNNDAKFVKDFAKDNFGGGKYLPWAKAWLRFKEKFPNGDFEVVEFENELPLPSREVQEVIAATLNNTELTLEQQSKLVLDVIQKGRYKIKSIYQFDPLLGYRVAVRLTLDGEKFFPPTCLAVMDQNMSMKDTAYTFTTRKGKETTIGAAAFTDIHNSIMRCLVKAIAINTGIGLSLWVNDDTLIATEMISAFEAEELREKIKQLKISEKWFLKSVQTAGLGDVKSLESLNVSQKNFIESSIAVQKSIQEKQSYLTEKMTALKMSEKDVISLYAAKAQDFNKDKPQDQKIAVPTSIGAMNEEQLKYICNELFIMEKKKTAPKKERRHKNQNLQPKKQSSRNSRRSF